MQMDPVIFWTRVDLLTGRKGTWALFTVSSGDTLVLNTKTCTQITPDKE
uniref:Uncharacterized protein n=1 Tax=Anguilla anguilla TaxID=7936 RepID=A0A0E9W6Z9_ANGAN